MNYVVVIQPYQSPLNSGLFVSHLYFSHRHTHIDRKFQGDEIVYIQNEDDVIRSNECHTVVKFFPGL